MSAPSPRTAAPSLRVEHALLRAGHDLVAGVDEVGRGALAGPVSVGVVLVGTATPAAPPGLRDSKLLTPAAREALVPVLREWAVAWSVGHAEPGEVDALGVTAALRLAGRRALAVLPVQPDAVLLDGVHDWMSDPSGELLLATAPQLPCLAPPVTTLAKADLTCASVAAASVLAKTERDALMASLHEDEPRYGWASNKGYGAPSHLAALVEHGPGAQHRRSWRLPGKAPAVVPPRASLEELPAAPGPVEGPGTGRGA